MQVIDQDLRGRHALATQGQWKRSGISWAVLRLTKPTALIRMHRTCAGLGLESIERKTSHEVSQSLCSLLPIAQIMIMCSVTPSLHDPRQLSAFEFRHYRTSLEHNQQKLVERVVNQWVAMLVKAAGTLN